MKKFRTYIAVLCTMLVAAACSNEMETETATTATDVAALVKIGGFPAFEENAQTRATVGTPDKGKTEWAANDEVLLKIQLKSADGSSNAVCRTFTYDGTKWNADKSLDITLSSYLQEAEITAYYAPAYKWSDASTDKPALKSGKAAGTDEYLVYSNTVTGISLADGINIDFSQKARDYSRLRVAAAPDMTVTLTAAAFTAAGTTNALDAGTIATTADAKGNAYFYGTWTANAQLSLKADWYEFTKTATASDAGKSYAINGVKPVKFGDIYFADGSWGTQAERTEQTPIAVVYYAGDPTNDDAALKRDHPGCTHGLAVALNDYDKSQWQSNYQNYGDKKTVGEWIDANTNNQYVSIVVHLDTGGNLNKILGYNNTKAIEAFNADAANSAWKVDIVENVVTYRAQVAAPSASSNWYVPSPKDWHLIATAGNSTDVYDEYDEKNLKISEINDVLTTISGAKAIELTSEDSYYWCSSESDNKDKNAACVIKKCEVADMDKAPNVADSKKNKVRFTLAF